MYAEEKKSNTIHISIQEKGKGKVFYSTFALSYHLLRCWGYLFLPVVFLLPFSGVTGLLKTFALSSSLKVTALVGYSW